MKLFTRILANEISERIPGSEKQQRFKTNRSITDAIFIVRQIAEKAIEFGKLAFMCFVDLTKAFDRVRLSDVTNIQKEEDMPEKVIQVVEALNSNTTTQIRVNNSLTEKVPIATGIRQGDSLSPQPTARNGQDNN